MTGTITQEPTISVGIVTQEKVTLSLDGVFAVEGGGRSCSGKAVASVEADGAVLGTEVGTVVHAKEITLVPGDPRTSSFRIYDVRIGKDFHWERTEHQKFLGALRLLRAGKDIVAINIIGIEDYLTSVVSSEMSAEGPMEFLKAHAIASRSWLIAQLGFSRELKSGAAHRVPSFVQEPGRLMRWYDREDHDLFDVCADDHCQRYQGVTKASTAAVAAAVEATRGMVLLHDGRVCDARFSKSCGGMSELYENAWDPEHHPYLVPIRDAPGEPAPALDDERNAEAWIRSSPPSFCRLDNAALFHRILPQVDRETPDSYRWRTECSQEELAHLIREKTGIDFGAVVALAPVRRGPSGRLVELRITGTKTGMTIGKELEIRRVLSPTHLRSSAFVVDADGMAGGVPERFRFTGAGWGHGVGLCQIGAGVMGDQGYTAEQILHHYYRGASIEHLYH